MATRPPHDQDRRHLRWERLNVISRRRRPGRSPSATCSPTSRASRTRVFRWRASCSGRSSSSRSTFRSIRSATAHISGVLRPGRLARLRSDDRQRGPALHAQLPVHRGERSGRRVQPGDPADGISRSGRPAARGPPAAQAGLRTAVRHRRPVQRHDGGGVATAACRSRWRASPRRSRRRLSRSSKPCLSARWTTSCRRSCWQRPTVEPIPRTPRRDLVKVCSAWTATRVGRYPAVEPLAPARAHAETPWKWPTSARIVPFRHPRHEPQSTHGRRVVDRRAMQRVPNPYFGTIRGRRRWVTRRSDGAAPQALPAGQTVSLYRNNVVTTIYNAFY